MKKSLLSFAIIVFSLTAYSQSGEKWATGGNANDPGNFLGTTNNQPVVVKTNNTERFRVKETGELLLNNVAGYAADYSSLFTARSLVDKTYVDNAIAGIPPPVVPTLATVLATGRNADASGNINTNTGSLVMNLNDRKMYNSAGFVKVDWEHGLLFNFVPPSGGVLSLDWVARELKGTDGVTTALNWNSRTLQGGRWDYDMDYSPTYTNRSLVDKGYVENRIASIPVAPSLWSAGAGQYSIMNNQPGNNSSQAQYSFIGAGNNNTIYANAQYGTILGGTNNQIQNIGGPPAPIHNMIGSGSGNIIKHNANYAVILSGQNNSVDDHFSLILGGSSNVIEAPVTQSSYNLISNGQNNRIKSNANYSSIIGGANNTMESGFYSVILGGVGNTIAPNVFNTVILSGSGVNATQSNTVYLSKIAFPDGTIQTTAAAGGGASQWVSSGSNISYTAGNVGIGTAAHGFDKLTVGGVISSTSGGVRFPDGSLQTTAAGASLLSPGTGQYAVMNNLPGTNNAQAQYSLIGAGNNNIVQTNAQFGAILAGENNQIQNFVAPPPGSEPIHNMIVSGNGNIIQHNARYSFIAGGQNNVLNDDYSTILGGVNNSILSSASLPPDSYNLITGGVGNSIQAQVNHSSIIGGTGNTVSSGVNNAVILGGTNINATQSNTVYMQNIAVTSLAGTGDRVMMIDANGNLKTLQSGSSTFWAVAGNTGTTPGTDFVGTTDDKDLVFKTDGIEQMRITSTGHSPAPEHPGNVGIGTSDPQKKLHIVTAHTVATTDEEASHGGIRLEDQITVIGLPNTTINAWDIQPYGGSTLAIRKPGQVPVFTLSDNGIAEIGAQFKIRANGNVLIGTPNAAGMAGKLQVVETAQNQPAIVGGDTASNSIWLVPNLGNAAYNPLSQTGDAGIIFRNQNQNAGNAGLVIAPHSSSNAGLRIAPDGNVGIGTGSPKEQFQIGNIFTFHDGGIKRIGRNVYYDAQAGVDKRIVGGNSSFASAISFDDAGNMKFSTAPIGPANSAITWTDAIIVTNNGNVGIGTVPDNPAYQLKVCGAIRTSRVVVELFGCDFVFEDDYKLVSLDQRRQHTEEKHHLPNIAPASEMQQSVDLGNFSEGLLRNLEEHELYLYDIAEKNVEQDKKLLLMQDLIAKQNKSIEMQNERIAELLKKIETLENR